MSTVPDPVYDSSRPHSKVQPIYQYPLVNCPGKTAVALQVTFPPNASTPPHRHGGASVMGVVIEGSLLNKMNDGPTTIIKKGESWYEAPGCHHRVSDNYSSTEPAILLATFVVDTEVLEKQGFPALVVIDEEYREEWLKGEQRGQ